MNQRVISNHRNTLNQDFHHKWLRIEKSRLGILLSRYAPSPIGEESGTTSAGYAGTIHNRDGN